ncbi:MAG: GNAT family N-acetyltransferase [Candidatus Pacearchaeota archaeon]|jgi:hypothetical protein
MISRYSIRHAKPQDVERIVRLNNQETQWVGERDSDFFMRYLEVPHFYVALDTRTEPIIEPEAEPITKHLGLDLLGFVLCMPESASYDSRNFLWFKQEYRNKRFNYIDRVVINPKVRRQGVASMLYDRIIRASGEILVVAEVSIDPVNDESIIFHERLGFKEVGQFSADGKKTCAMMVLD